MELNYSIISDYLIRLIEYNDWNKIILFVEIQPGVLGLSGSLFLNTGERISLRTKPTELLETTIKHLHQNTATSNTSKWNFLEFELRKDGSFSIKYIWNQEYQNKIDKQNNEEVGKNSNYKLPKWSWEE